MGAPVTDGHDLVETLAHSPNASNGFHPDLLFRSPSPYKRHLHLQTANKEEQRQSRLASRYSPSHPFLPLQPRGPNPHLQPAPFPLPSWCPTLQFCTNGSMTSSRDLTQKGHVKSDESNKKRKELRTRWKNLLDEEDGKWSKAVDELKAELNKIQ
ncbi:hypothetical protein DXG01_009885 [Tephrocybe rancida]|nr:hypothetical protein DXG01_009885 [Tephrocybe rancida]